MNDRFDEFLKTHAATPPQPPLGHERRFFQILASKASQRKRQVIWAVSLALGAAASLVFMLMGQPSLSSYQEEQILEDTVSAYTDLLDDEESIYQLSSLD